VSRPAAVVLGCHWLDRRSELAFVTRSIAGAASRCGEVAVLVPGVPGRREADGAFDLQAIGQPGALRWPAGGPMAPIVIVDDLTSEVTTLLADARPTSVHFLSGTAPPARPTWRHLAVVGGASVGVHVPVNRLAERDRHHGFGFTDYLLVLGDRPGEQAEPPPAAAWLSGAFPDADVVVIEDAVASAWKGRALRGRVSVDTRMDLWRLLAHANVCVDLAPGGLIARACVEAMRFGTPVIVPAGSGPAVTHARATDSAAFGDEAELLEAVGALRDATRRAEASDAARRYADERYGDPHALVRRLEGLLSERSPNPGGATGDSVG
jgi:hypothetical protein